MSTFGATRKFSHNERTHPQNDVLLERALAHGKACLIQPSFQRLVVPRGILASPER